MRNLLINHFIILGLALSLSACNGVGTAKFDQAAVGTGGTIDDGTGQIVNFSGITSISNATDSTLTLNWTAHADAVAYHVYSVSGGTVVFLTTIFGQSSSTYTITGLSAGVLYQYRVRAVDSSSRTDKNTQSASATTLTTTATPSGLTLIAPATASDVSDTPTVRVSGVKSGDTIRLFTNNTCTTQVATGTASGTTIDLTSSSLAVGAYNFYATAGTSTCSTATLSYTRIACSSGYALSGGVCALSFAGITSIDQITDKTMRLNWTAHTAAVAYNIYYITAGTPVFLTTVTGQSSSSYTSTGLTAGATYQFRVRAVDVSSNIDSNTTSQTATTLSTTPTPSALTLIAPATASNVFDTPTIRVGGVKTGDTVNLFTNSTCTTQVATGVASGAAIDLTTSSLAVGAYNFYATAGTSACSSATLTYTRTACPVGYVLNGSNCVLDFAGITSISNTTDSTLTLNWASHSSATVYQVYQIVSGSPVFLVSVTAPASSRSFTGLTPSTSYTYKVVAFDSTGSSDINNVTQTVTTNSAPNVPSSLAIVTPSSPSFSATQTVRVSGVKSGDTIRLFTNSSCTTQVALGVATGTSIDFTTSVPGAGTYNFYANSTNTIPSASACSTATVSYQKLDCPANFIPVAPNSAVGTTSEFCVMTYEAKCVGTSCPTATPGANAVATSQAAGNPWGTISPINSKTACTNLNALNGVSNKYDLISNPEWMTIAYSLESVAANWSGSAVGSGHLNRGWSGHIGDDGFVNSGVAPSTSAACLYNSAANTCSSTGLHKLKRTHTLSNGEVIWDFAGNLLEWVDWGLGGVFNSGPTSCAGGNVEIPNVSCGALAAADYMPGNPGGITAIHYNSTYGLGRFTGGSGGAAVRGGYFNSGWFAGPFRLDLSFTSLNSAIGFRCVYRL